VAALIAAQRNQRRIPHTASCRALGVSQSWFYKWRGGALPPRAARRTRLAAEYTAGAFRAACQRLGVSQSMGRPGSALDNAVIESWHSTLEFELRRLEHFATRQLPEPR
jgi:transposase InsO family protein